MNVTTENEAVVELQEKLKRYCLFLTENLWDADDLAQEAWLKVLNARKLSHEHANPQALLLRIAKNSWIDHTRRRKLRYRYEEHQKQIEDTTDSEAQLGELECIFQALINHMTPLQRAVFLLRDVYDYSIIETAQMLNTTQGAVKAALNRARQALVVIKNELVANEPAVEQDVGLLMSLAAAYQLGDVAKVLMLAMNGIVEPSAAVIIAYNQNLKVKSMHKNVNKSDRDIHYMLGSMVA